MIKNYLKIAFRNFGRHKLFTLINIIGLSVGISAALVIYLIVSYDFTFDNFHKGGDRIYRVVTNMNYSGEAIFNSGVTSPLPNVVSAEVTGLEASAPCFEYSAWTITVPGKTLVKFKGQGGTTFVDQRFFNLFAYQWLAGSAKNSLNAPRQVVLASEQAKKYFPLLSYDQMIGRQVIYNDSVKTTVTGIVKEFEGNSDITFHTFISYSTISTLFDMKRELTEWGGVTSASLFFIKLAPGTKAQNIEKQLNALLTKYTPKHPEFKGNNTTALHLQPLSDVHFNSNYGAIDDPPANKTTLYGLMVIATFLLILGCINFINLTTAQASQRAKEIGIRKTMGSSKAQLIFQFLSETFLITLFAVVAAACLAPVIIKLFSGLISPAIKADFVHRPDLMLFLLVLAVVVSFLSGFYPALVLSRYKPVLVLKNQAFTNAGKTRNSWLRKSLTVSQFIIAQFFIMATILVSKQIYYAIHTDLGFKKDAIIYIGTPWNDKVPGHRQIFFNKIKALPQVEMVSIGQDVPSSGGWSSSTYTYKDGKKEISTQLHLKSGDENYIKVYKIKLLAGRNISVVDTAYRGIVINSSYAHVLGFKNVQDAVGKYLDKTQIVGVMADFHQASLHTPIKPLGLQYANKYSGTIHIALKPQAAGNDWKLAISSMEKAWKQLYPDQDFDYAFFDDTIAKLYASEQHTSTLLTWATGLSILISCLGLLGLAMYTTTRRTKEIGVRKVLGATVTQIVKLLSTELVVLVLLAFAIVTPLAWLAMNKWMQNFVDKTTISWWIFVLSGAGMLLTALITLSFQTIKAAIANPVKSLRSE